MRAGIVGGTLDPVHMGHLLLAEESRVRLDLEEVVFIPTGSPWMKSERAISPAHHRLNMARLATRTNPFFRVSSMEIDRPGATYTVDTLEQVHREGDDDLYFILGVDSLQDFEQWKEPAKVLSLCTVVAGPRPGYTPPDIGSIAAIHPSGRDEVVFLDGPLVDISGTEIRGRVAKGMSVRYLVPEEVERYICRYGLYRDIESPP